MIQLKQAHEKPSPQDGFRVLIERHWPRDLDEKHAKIDLWQEEMAPSEELHVQYGGSPDPARWTEFRRRYEFELKQKRKTMKLLRDRMQEGTVTLLHADHNPDHTAAAVLKHYLEVPGAPEGQL